MKAAALSFVLLSCALVAGCSGAASSPGPTDEAAGQGGGGGAPGASSGAGVGNQSGVGASSGAGVGNQSGAGAGSQASAGAGSEAGTGGGGQGGSAAAGGQGGAGGGPAVLAGGPDGFASVEGYGIRTTTGGAGGPVVTVSTTEELLDYIARPGPHVIQVAGTIALPTGTTDGMHDVTSHKTIVGLGADATLTGGGLKIGLPVDDAITSPPPDAVHNIIIRNLKITGASDDLINIQMFSHHIWIDHCDLSNGGDGALDIKRGSDLITVSWNHFYDHTKTCLLGHDELGASQDVGRLRVTYHHNFFDRSDQRNPRVRFGEPVHVYNNYYNDNSYGIAATWNAGVVAEGNYFFSVNNPGRVLFEDNEPGRMIARDNTLVDCNHEIEVAGPVIEPSTYYDYTLDRSMDVPALVMAGAGVGKIDP
ncbi:pectate lyase family protein [Sorangium sp. So ce1151]|uniref:pectate lyase family protein n=1 Tax=Sorangium sp. So ce1151 TaxID=3133332 RepID=UPI003F5FC1EA